MSALVSDAQVRLLAEAGASSRWDTLDEEIKTRLRDVLIDTVAVAAHGSRTTAWTALEAAWSSDVGTATVIGSSIPHSAGVSAALNGAALWADQLQDGHRLAKGHPAAHVVPALLGIADSPTDGGEFLAAFLDGYEVAVRVSRAMGGTRSGVHDIGAWGTVGAAVAVAKLLSGGDPEAVYRAIGLAASTFLNASTTPVFTGQSGQATLLGAAIQQGISLGVAASANLDAGAGAMGHLARHAAQSWDEAALVDGVADGQWSEFQMLNGYLKIHPTCAHLHGANDAAFEIARTSTSTSPIASVVVETYEHALEFDDVMPENGDAARFSIPWTVAAILTLQHLDDAAFAEQFFSPLIGETNDVASLAVRIKVVHNLELDARYPNGRPTTVSIRREDGSLESAHSERPIGDADQHDSRLLLREKARHLLTKSFGSTKAIAIEDAIDRLGSGVAIGKLLLLVSNDSLERTMQ